MPWGVIVTAGRPADVDQLLLAAPIMLQAMLM
jgi:hypothetical protein